MMTPEKDEIETWTLEETFQKLQEIVDRLEEEEVGIEDSFSYYEQGMCYLKACHDKIDMVEKKILSLNKAGELDEF